MGYCLGNDGSMVLRFPLKHQQPTCEERFGKAAYATWRRRSSARGCLFFRWSPVVYLIYGLFCGNPYANPSWWSSVWGSPCPMTNGIYLYVYIYIFIIYVYSTYFRWIYVAFLRLLCFMLPKKTARCHFQARRSAQKWWKTIQEVW